MATCPALSLADPQIDVRKYIGVSSSSAAETIGGRLPAITNTNDSALLYLSSLVDRKDAPIAKG